MNIGENIRRIRKEKGISMKSLGKMVNVSEQAIGNYERGDRTANTTILDKIADALGVSVIELIDTDGNIKKALKNINNTIKDFYSDIDENSFEKFMDYVLETFGDRGDLSLPEGKEIYKRVNEFVEFELYKLEKANLETQNNKKD